ncbi:portal protein [Frankia sp. RB7]|nr:portal protein [Frankia sp. RB7]
MSAWSEIEPRHAEVKKKRALEEPRWRDIARLMQSDEDLSGGNRNDQRQPNGDDPFDSTPLYANDDYVGGMFSKATNPAERWFSWGVPADPELAKWKPAKDYLWNYTTLILASIDPTIDNFYLNVPGWFGDMGMFGSGFMWQEEMVGQGRIVTPNLAVSGCYKDVDANGDLDTFHREIRLTGRQAKGKFGDRAPTARDDEEIVFVHAISPNPEFRPGSPFAKHMPFKSCYASPDKTNFYTESGYLDLPVHQIEWSMRSGRVWARGPAHNALPDMLSLDEVARSTMVGIQFDAEPMWWAADEDVMTTADIVPGNVLFGESVQGKAPAQILERSKQMSLPLQLQNDLRNQVRRAFRFALASTLGARPQMTAEEVQAFSQDELKSLAPNLIRVQRGLAGFIRRRAQLLDRLGVVARTIGPPPPELLRAAVTPTFVSPFVKAQKADTANGATSWVSTKLKIAAETQDPTWMDDIDVDGYSALLHDALSGVPSIKLDPRLVEQKRQARAQAQAAQVQLAQQEQQAAIYADVSHADQAKTLAKGRAGK